jgi:cation:H+ antiporter
MLTAAAAVIVGLALLVWSADRFVDGAAITARHFGMPPLLIGMIILGFGTSAPEMVVSAIAALEESPVLALGNAYGSNITNIALILGLTALISPIAVESGTIRKELPILLGVTAVAAWQVWDGELSRTDGWTLLAIFAFIMAWTIRQGVTQRDDHLASDTTESLASETTPIGAAIIGLIIGLVVLVASSHLLVWGAVTIATHLGISEMIIGLTVVAVGTSLPELAASLMAIRKGEHDLAIGNVVGSNLFNTLAVVGIASTIHPLAAVPAEVLQRDILLMALLTLAILIFGMRFRGRDGRINRAEGAILFATWIGYTLYLVNTAILSGGT